MTSAHSRNASRSSRRPKRSPSPVLIAVSPQKPDGSLTSAESNELRYAVASDPGNRIAAALGILTEPSPDSIAAQKKLGLDLSEVNAAGEKTLAMPTSS